MKTYRNLFLLALAFITGCASTRQFVPLPDQAKTVEDPSKGRIYVMRPASGFWDSSSMLISESGRLIGETGPRGYLCWEQGPGPAIVTGKAEGVSQVPILIEAGRVYYIFEHLRAGLLKARNELELVEEKEAMEVLKKCSRPIIAPPPPSGFSVVKEGEK